jgi:uncharacterized membrane protein
MNNFNTIFFRGLVTLIPIALTIYIIYSAVVILENALGSLLQLILPENFYIPGFGVIATLATIFFFGLALNNFIAGKILSEFEKRIKTIPFVKAIYSPVKDLMGLFSKKDQSGFSSVVLVKTPDNESYAMGLITRENFRDLQLQDIGHDKVAVFFPLSYGLGGFTFLVPKSRVVKIDLPVDKAMSLSITGWVKSDSGDQTTDSK